MNPLPPVEVEPHPWRGLAWLTRRECHRVLKLWKQTILAPVISSLLFMIVFGLSLGDSIAEIGGFDRHWVNAVFEATAGRHAEAIVLAHHGRQVQYHRDARRGRVSVAQEGQHRDLVLVVRQPLEAARLAVAGMQRGQGAVQAQHAVVCRGRRGP